MLFYLQTKLSIKLQSFPPLMGPGKNIIESISDIKYVSARLQQDKKHCILAWEWDDIMFWYTERLNLN